MKTEAGLLKLWQGIPARFVGKALEVYGLKEYWRDTPKCDMALNLVKNPFCVTCYSGVNMDAVAIDARRRMEIAATKASSKTKHQAMLAKRNRLLAQLSKVEAHKMLIDLINTPDGQKVVNTPANEEFRKNTWRAFEDAVDRAYLTVYVDRYLAMETLIERI